jgi:hypothetical protein
MSILLKDLAKYDENLTIAQLKKAIELERVTEKEKEKEEIDRIKKTFYNIYLKETKDCRLFGKTLNVYHIVEIVDSGRCEDWSLFYHVAGTKISFSKNDIRHRRFNPERVDDTFSEKDLTSMTQITKEEFNSYEKQYIEISTILNSLIE